MESKPATDLSLEQLASVFNEGFENYMGQVPHQNATILPAVLHSHFVSLERSRIYFSNDADGTPVARAFALVSVREDRPTAVRLGGMAVTPVARGKGAGKQILAEIMQLEREAGSKTMDLECFKINAPALALYRRMGFETVYETAGWERGVVGPIEFDQNPGLERTTTDEVIEICKNHADDEITWQAYGWSRTVRENTRAYKLGHAYGVIDVGEGEEPMRMLTLVVEKEHRGKGEARALVRAVLAKYSGKRWVINPRFPKHVGAKLAAECGFRDHELQQFLMRVQL